MTGKLMATHYFFRVAQNTFLAGAVGAAVFLGACAGSNPAGGGSEASISGTVASEATATNVRHVGFLTDYARLRPMPGGGGLLCWRTPGIHWSQYNKVMFERIQVYLAAGTGKSVDPTDLKMLIDYFHKDLVTAIQPVAQVVNATGPGVLRVRFALTNLVPTNTTASLVGTAAPYGFVAEIGSGAAAGKPAGSTPYLGQTGMEVQFRDGVSGDIVAECADMEIGVKYAADMNAGVTGAAETWVNGYMDSFKQWTYAKNAFDKWATEFAQRFAELRNG
jgi:hypothetical protein